MTIDDIKECLVFQERRRRLREGPMTTDAIKEIMAQEREEQERYERVFGGRHPLTVAELMEKLSKLDPAMPVKVAHDRVTYPIGHSDPIIRACGILGIDAVNERGIPSYGPTGNTWLVID